MEPSPKVIEALKKILEKDLEREFTWEEATKAARDMYILADIAIGLAKEEHRRQQKLKESPQGFHLDKEGYSCLICQHSAEGEDSWFDEYGLKCMRCQKAIDDKIVPGYIAKDRESYYGLCDLEMHFNLTGATLRKYIKKGILIDRVIPADGKKPPMQLFLLKDNKKVLPPKKLLPSRTIKVLIEEKEYYTSEFWYEFTGAKGLERLKKYKIIEYLPETFAQPIKARRFYYESINPLFEHRDAPRR